MRHRTGRSEPGEHVQGLDLARKNTELKEEVRALKEQQNVLLRESLRHQYTRYKTNTEALRILEKHAELLQDLLLQTREGMREMQQDADVESSPQHKLKENTSRNPLRENLAKKARNRFCD